MNVHLVFNSEHIEILSKELEKMGYTITETDTSLDTFEHWAKSKDQENKSEIAFVYGAVNVSKYDSHFSHRQAVFERLRTVRIERPELRIILVFTPDVQEDVHFLQKLIQIGIHDLYFEDQLSVEHIFNWLKRQKTLADVQHLISDYNGTVNDEITESHNNFSGEQEEPIEEELVEDSRRFEIQKKKRDERKKNSFFLKKQVANPIEKKEKKEKVAVPTTSMFANLKVKNPLENVKIKTPSFSLPSRSSVTNVIQAKVIAVGSLHGGAGSTFLIHNFLDYLAEEGLQSGVLEATEHSPVWLQIRGRELGEIPKNFESWIAQMKNTESFNVRARIETHGIQTIPLASTDSITGIDLDVLHTVIFTARQIPLLFVDISTDWENDLAQEILKICDEFWVVLNPDPNHLSSQRHKKKAMMNLAFQQTGEEHCIFIGNKWGKGIDLDEFPIQPSITLPYFEQGMKANMKGRSLYSMNSRLFKPAFKTLSKRVLQPIKNKQALFEVNGG